MNIGGTNETNDTQLNEYIFNTFLMYIEDLGNKIVKTENTMNDDNNLYIDIEKKEEKIEEKEDKKIENIKEDKKENLKEDQKEDKKEDLKEDLKEDKKEDKKDDKKEDLKEDKKEELKEDKDEDLKEDEKKDDKIEEKEDKKEYKTLKETRVLGRNVKKRRSSKMFTYNNQISKTDNLQAPFKKRNTNRNIPTKTVYPEKIISNQEMDIVIKTEDDMIKETNSNHEKEEEKQEKNKNDNKKMKYPKNIKI